MLHQTDCAYLAGLIDADGNIGMEKFGGHRIPTVKMHLSNTNLQILDEMQKMWGGRIYQYERQDQPTWKTGAYLRWHGTKAVSNVLNHIRPYMRIKAPQADLALLFAETVNERVHRTRRLTPATKAIRQEVGNVMSLLNKKGTTS